MKKIILFILVLVVLGMAVFFVLNFGKVSTVQAPQKNIPSAMIPPETGDENNDGTGLANPASIYCEQQGGRLEIRNDASGGQYGVCVMPDGTQCDEWEFYRTQVCSPSGGAVGDKAVCERENCHGLDIKCGPNPAQVCTMEYQLGDKCLQYAKCGVVDGTCQQISDPQFDACKSCVQKCQNDFGNDQIKMFDCENNCQ